MSHKYQLVIQLPACAQTDYDRLIALEEAIFEAVGQDGIVDGHDFGSGEANIFVHCDNPARVFHQIQERALVPCRLSVKAAYRPMDGEKYVILHPLGLEDFKVI